MEKNYKTIQIKRKRQQLTAVKKNGLGKGILPNFLRKFKSLRYICFGLVLARRHFF
jgi:hypothetical protein